MRRDRGLKGDLDNIVLMALRKEPERRYTSVEQFSEDVRRYPRRLPVIARDDTFGYRAGKFVQRNRAGVLIGSIAALGLIAATVVTAREANHAEQARRVAEAQRAEAQKRLGQLVELAQASLFHVQETLEHMPGALEARRDVIETTVRYLDGLAAESKDDTGLLDLLGSGYTQVGDVLGFPGASNLGDREGAMKAWGKARAIFTHIEQVKPGDVSAELQDMGIHQRIGNLIESTGDRKGAVVEYRAALAIAVRLARLHPKDWKIMSQPAIMEHFLGLSLLAQKDPAAIGHVREEIRIYQAAVVLDPDNPELTRSLASGYSSLARVMISEGNFPAALTELRRSHAIREKLLAKFPNDAILKSSVAASHVRMAVALGAPWQPSMGDRVAAMEEMGKAIPVRMGLYAADSQDRKAKADVAEVLTWAGAIEPDARAALPNLRRAATMLGELRAADPKQVTYTEEFALAHEYIGRHLEEQGNLAGAVGAYRQALTAKQSATVAARLADCERRLAAR